MRCRLLPLPMLLAASLALMPLPGCVSSPGKLSVDLGPALKECQKLGSPVSVSSFDDKSDYADLSAETLAALNKAHRGSLARTRCEDQVIDGYAKAK